MIAYRFSIPEDSIEVRIAIPILVPPSRVATILHLLAWPLFLHLRNLGFSMVPTNPVTPRDFLQCYYLHLLWFATTACVDLAIPHACLPTFGCILVQNLQDFHWAELMHDRTTTVFATLEIVFDPYWFRYYLHGVSRFSFVP